MISFSKFVTENTARMVDRTELELRLAQYKKAGEIVNPEYQDLVKQANRIFSKEAKQAQAPVFEYLVRGGEELLRDLYYDWPTDYLTSLGKFEKTLAKVKKFKWEADTQPKVAAVVSAADKVLSWKPVADDLKELKTKVVKVTTKREQVKVVAAQATQKKFADSSSLIKIFESHLEEYKQMAAKRAKEFLDGKIAELEKAGWDLNKVGPRPSSMMDTVGYRAASSRRALYAAITKSTTYTSKPGDPDIRKVDQAAVSRYISNAEAEAESSYRTFMQKMIEKIGKPVVDARMTGSIWTGATLTVQTVDGETQVWDTKMILNFSKYQKMFNQFPSRRKK